MKFGSTTTVPDKRISKYYRMWNCTPHLPAAMADLVGGKGWYDRLAALSCECCVPHAQYADEAHQHRLPHISLLMLKRHTCGQLMDLGHMHGAGLAGLAGK